MSAYRSSLFRSLKKEVSEKLPQGLGCLIGIRLFEPWHVHVRFPRYAESTNFVLYASRLQKSSKGVGCGCLGSRVHG